MKEDAEYEIEITDPKKGKANHTPYIFENSKRRGLKKTPATGESESEEEKYNKKRAMQAPALTDLDFHTSKERRTKLIFTITHGDYKFAPLPLFVEPGNSNEDMVVGSRVTDHVAEVYILGSSNSGNRRKYTLLYIDKNDEYLVHDPVILNGEDDPGPIKPYDGISFARKVI